MKGSVRFGIVADDFTSAADGVVGFGSHGWNAEIRMDLADEPTGEAVAIDTRSRHLELREAAAAVDEAVRRLSHAPLLAKQFDSTLRGHVGGEICAALRASGRDHAIVAPAFPDAGRTTKHGHQYVGGDRVEHSHFARDSRNPVDEGHVPTLLERAGARGVASIHPIAANDREPIDRAFAHATYVVVDGQTEDDLDALVAAVPEPDRVLWCGSTGLMRALARAHPAPHFRGVAQPPVARALVLVGSVNPSSRTQLRELLQHDGVFGAALDSGNPEADVQRLTREIVDTARNRERADTLVVFSKLSDAVHADAIAGALAAVAASTVARIPIDAIVVTGGDIAAAVVRALHPSRVVALREIEPGIPYLRVDGPRPVILVTKAGGFGPRDALNRILNAIRAERV